MLTERRTKMAFPFLWIGALTAGLFLAAMFVAFWLAVSALGRTVGEIRGSMLPGLVSGFRDWTTEERAVAEPPPTDPTEQNDASIEDLGSAMIADIVHVDRR